LDKLIPTRYNGPVEQGGSTKPWKVSAIIDSEFDNPTEQPYIVKLFSPSIVEQHPCIAKEFICNALATEFDLFVPDPGIINLNTPDFLKTLNKKDIGILNQRFKGETFASKLLDGPLVSKSLKDSPSNIEDKAMIYAFDSFILNIDRWGIHEKPNLIIRDERFMLIDHELSLSFMDQNNRRTLDLILNGINVNRPIFPYKNHLFFNSLKMYPDNKAHLFHTFQEYLMNLNINAIRILIDELESNHINSGFAYLLFEYLSEIKGLSGKFCETLLNTIL